MTNVHTWESVVKLSATALEGSGDPATVANPFLHPLNGHPNAVRQYRRYLSGEPSFGSALYHMAAGLATELSALLHPIGTFQGDPVPDATDILFISHFLNASQATEGRDLYFGEAPEQLRQRGVASVTALIDHTGTPGSVLASTWQPGRARRILLPRTLPYLEELAIARRLNSAARRNGYPLSQVADASRRFQSHARASAASRGSRTAMRIAGQVGDLVRRLRPRALVSTYEGHSWERLAFRAARDVDPDILCIGYHHALLFPATTAMVRRLGHGFDPDRILTAGQRTTAWLRSQPSLEGVPIDTLGSVRAPEAATSPVAVGKARCCLVLPEGTHSETVKLVRLACDGARLAPSVTFRIRLHPVLTLDGVLRREPALRSLPSNIVWSDTSLNDDLRNARWALYRGTTAVIAATIAGLKPFYFDDGGPDIDPIGGMTCWRERVSGAQDLTGKIEMDMGQQDAERIASHDSAVAYCRMCFSAFDAEMLRIAITDQVAS